LREIRTASSRAAFHLVADDVAVEAVQDRLICWGGACSRLSQWVPWAAWCLEGERITGIGIRPQKDEEQSEQRRGRPFDRPRFQNSLTWVLPRGSEFMRYTRAAIRRERCFPRGKSIKKAGVRKGSGVQVRLG